MGRAGRFSAWMLALAVTGSGLACTSARKAGTPSGAEQAAVTTCFSIRDVESFSPLHGRFLYVRLVHGEEFLLTLDSLYTNLPFATGVRFAGSFNNLVCSNSGATLTFTDFGNRVSARIIRVEPVDSKEAAQQLVADRTAQ